MSLSPFQIPPFPKLPLNLHLPPRLHPHQRKHLPQSLHPFQKLSLSLHLLHLLCPRQSLLLKLSHLNLPRQKLGPALLRQTLSAGVHRWPPNQKGCLRFPLLQHLHPQHRLAARLLLLHGENIRSSLLRMHSRRRSASSRYVFFY